MPPISQLFRFHHWLLAQPSPAASAPTLVLHGKNALHCDALILDIADYLDEYDDQATSRWLPATSVLIEEIARSPHQLARLGLAPNPSAPVACHHALAYLAQRGHVILRADPPRDFDLQRPSSFHVGVGPSPNLEKKCHLILNSALWGQKCIAHVIGDVFLEWLHGDLCRSRSLHEVR